MTVVRARGMDTVSIPAGSFKPPPWDAANSAPHGMTFYAIAADNERLMAALERRRLEANVAYAKLAEDASLEPGFVSGAFGGSRTRILGLKRSLFFLAAALGLRVALLYDPVLDARYAKGRKPRHANQARPNNYSSQPGTRTMSRVFKHIAKNGGKARMKKMSPAERFKHQSDASNERWRKFRRRRKASPRDDCQHSESPV